MSKVIIHATETEVVIIAAAVSSTLDNSQIWVGFHQGAKPRYVPCHLIAFKLGAESSWVLLLMPAFSECDSLGLSWCRKVNALACLVQHASSEARLLQVVKIPKPCIIRRYGQNRYVVLLYQRTCFPSKVIEARKTKSVPRNRKIENVPPNTHALQQDVKRAVYQAGQCLQSDPTLPSPAAWSWEKTDPMLDNVRSIESMPGTTAMWL